MSDRRASRLSIKVGLGGNLSGSVAGSAYIFDQFLTDASNPAQLIQNLIVGDFSAAAGLYLRADAGIVIETSAASANGPVSIIADSIMMNTGSQVTSGGLVTIAGLGNVTWRMFRARMIRRRRRPSSRSPPAARS